MDTFGMPIGAVKLASSENTPNQGFRFGRRAYGLQYHIELTPQMLDVWLHHPDYRKEMIQVLGPEAPAEIEGQRSTCYPTYREHTRMLFENFLRMSELV
jgi:GMP synthase-like glutamine amidotransferase